MIPNPKPKKPRSRTKIDTSDRPGDITKMYENIETGEKGTIVKYEDKYKTLAIETVDGKYDHMTYGTFRRLWREADESISENK